MIPMINPDWSAILVDASLRGSVVLLTAFGVAAVMRRAPAAARHLVWTLALSGALVIPLLGSVLPAWPVLTLPAVNAPTIAMSTSGGVSLLASWETMAVPPVQRETHAAPAVQGVPPVHHELLDWRWIAAVLWAAGAVLLALRLLVGVARVRWLARRAVPVDDAAWLQLAHVLARRFGLARPVTLLRSERGSVPMTWGTVYPVVLLPAEADGWSNERRTVVLAHELAHIRRWDAATQWIAHLALALYWFNPLVWIAARRLRDERERACDDAVLAVGTRPAEYANHLLDIVRSLGNDEGPVAALAMARRSQFEGRLLAILDRAVSRGGVSGRAALGAALFTAAVILPLAALRAAEPSAEAVTDASDVLVPPAPAIVTHAAPVAPARAVPDTVKPVLQNPDVVQRALVAYYPPLRRAAAPEPAVLFAAVPSTTGEARAAADTVRPRLLDANQVIAALQRTYPPQARDAGAGGKVLIRAQVARNGRVLNTLVVHMTNDDFAKAAADAIYEARFAPATYNGRTVPYTQPVAVAFRVGKAGPEALLSLVAAETDSAQTPESGRFVPVPAPVRDPVGRPLPGIAIRAQFEETHALIRRAVQAGYPEAFSHGLSRDQYLWFLVGPSGQIEKTGVETVAWGRNGWSSTSIRQMLESKFPEIQIQHSYHTVGLEMGRGAKVNAAWITRM